MGKIKIPPPPTEKNRRSRYNNTPNGRKVEARRLHKALKAGMTTQHDLTDWGKILLKRHYPVRFDDDK